MSRTMKIYKKPDVILANPNYHKVHHFLNRKIGKAFKCENPNCTNTKPKIYHWALRKGFQYEEKVENFIMLCVPCHVKYDVKPDTKAKMSAAKKRKIVLQKNRDGSLVREFDSLCSAATITNISKSNILYTIKGVRKSAGNFLWSYK